MVTLAYWNIQGLAQPIRHLLEYLQIEYKDKHYEGNGEEWFNKDKKELKSNFPNIPYLIDGETVVTESSVIPVYLIRKNKKFELLGQNADGSFNENEVKVLQVIAVLKDLMTQFVQAIMTPSFKEQEQKDKLYNEKFSVFLEKLRKQLGDQQFMVGSLTYADFVAYSTLSAVLQLYPKANQFEEYLKRFENIPQIKAYKASDRAVTKTFREETKHLFHI